jgi:transcriptional regulator with XRE-family HTH domain
MRKRHLSSNHLADFAGMGRSSVAAILRGAQSPTLKTLDKLATALDVKVADLLKEP